IEQIGCYPITANTPASYLLVFMWPFIFGIASAIYVCLTLRIALRRNSFINETLRDSKHMTTGQYWCLMAWISLVILCTIPLGLSNIVISSSGDMVSYVVVGDIPTYSAAQWRSFPAERILLELARWIYPICAFIMFTCFGFDRRALKFYRKAQEVFREIGSIVADGLSIWFSVTFSPKTG
ncbi:hypothetical protein CONPUDRAFT_64657, partial [Coniophora puteana RWD-64-598 SS2]